MLYIKSQFIDNIDMCQIIKTKHQVELANNLQTSSVLLFVYWLSSPLFLPPIRQSLTNKQTHTQIKI